MNIQIIGTKKCQMTRKAVRFFKERRIDFHLLDLNERSLARGELNNILQAVDADALIDSESAAYRKRGMRYMEFDPVEEILEDNSLLKTPVIRNGRKVAVGDDEHTWRKWIDEDN